MLQLETERSTRLPGALPVIEPNRLSDFVRKGENTARYYNPGNLFDDVHLLLTNDDQVSREAVQPMVGTARLTLHNLPSPKHFFLRTLGWRRPFIEGWLKAAVSCAAGIGPRLVRCHGADLNLLAAIWAHPMSSACIRGRIRCSASPSPRDSVER